MIQRITYLIVAIPLNFSWVQSIQHFKDDETLG